MFTSLRSVVRLVWGYVISRFAGSANETFVRVWNERLVTAEPLGFHLTTYHEGTLPFRVVVLYLSGDTSGRTEVVRC